MIIAGFVVSVLALLGSGVAIIYTRRAAAAAERQAVEASRAAEAAERQAVEARRQADAAHEELHIAHAPRLTVTRQKEPAQGSEVLYEIRNEGPRDLDSVLVRRPQASDKVTYPIARLGVTDFEDEIELGPLGLGEAGMLLLKVGSTQTPPEFRIRITCRSGPDTWDSSHFLAPRPKPPRVRRP